MRSHLQNAVLVTELAQQLGVNLTYIPAYSPNLNLIERLWKHAKGKLRTKYYDCFDLFKNKIDSIVSSTDKEEKSIIDRLIGEKVQLFDDLIAVNESSTCNAVWNYKAA